MASVIEKVQSGFKSLSEGKLGEALTMASNLADSVNATWIQKPGAQSVAGQLKTLADSAKTHVTSGPTFTVKGPTQADLKAITTEIPAIPYVEPDASFDTGNAKNLWDILIRTRNEVNAKKKSSPLTPTVIQDIQSSEAQYNTLLADYKKKYTDWKGANLGLADKKARDRALTKSATQEITDANKAADDILKKVLNGRSLYTKGFNENAKTFRETFIQDFIYGNKDEASEKYTTALTGVLNKISHLSLTNSARGISAEERNKLTATSKEKKEAADRVAKVIKELPPMGTAPIIAKKGYRDAYNMMKTARDAVITFVEGKKEYSIQPMFEQLRNAYLAEKARYDNYKGITKKEKQLATDAIAGLTLQEEPRQKNAKAAYAELGINEKLQAIGNAYIAAEAAGRNPKTDVTYTAAKQTYEEAVSEFKAQWMDGDKIRSVSKNYEDDTVRRADEIAKAKKASANEKIKTDELKAAKTLALTVIVRQPPNEGLNDMYQDVLAKKVAAVKGGATEEIVLAFKTAYDAYEQAVAAATPVTPSPPAAAAATPVISSPPAAANMLMRNRTAALTKARREPLTIGTAASSSGPTIRASNVPFQTSGTESEREAREQRALEEQQRQAQQQKLAADKSAYSTNLQQIENILTTTNPNITTLRRSVKALKTQYNIPDINEKADSLLTRMNEIAKAEADKVHANISALDSDPLHVPTTNAGRIEQARRTQIREASAARGNATNPPAREGRMSNGINLPTASLLATAKRNYTYFNRIAAEKNAAKRTAALTNPRVPITNSSLGGGARKTRRRNPKKRRATRKG